MTHKISHIWKHKTLHICPNKKDCSIFLRVIDNKPYCRTHHVVLVVNTGDKMTPLDEIHSEVPGIKFFSTDYPEEILIR